MMRIRCPNCDSTHEVPPSVLDGKPRKVRCAACRSVFEASPEGDSPAMTDERETLDWSDLDASIDARRSMPTAEAETERHACRGCQSQYGCCPRPGRSRRPVCRCPCDTRPGSRAYCRTGSRHGRTSRPGSLGGVTGDNRPARCGQDAAALAAASAAKAATAAQRQDMRPKWRNPHSRPRKRSLRLAPALGVVAATGIGTLVGLTIFRHETVRIAPSLAHYFEMIGLEVNSTGLEIRGVRSQVVMEDHREMLEITGQIVNITRQRQPVPVMRLALHNAEGQQIYVWTGSADSTELGRASKTQFRRRLASPPKDAAQVMVRFVARDDIVAAIR